MHVLFVHPGKQETPPEWSREAVRQGWTVSFAEDFRAAAENAAHGQVDAVVVPAPHGNTPTEGGDFENLLRVLDSRRVATLVLSEARLPVHDEARSLMETVRRDISIQELSGRLAMIRRYHGLVQALEQELSNLETLSKRLNLHFRDIDQEMRLAGRLQRDFLPDTREPLGNLRFASVYRPANWVSGDMFDIFRIDETRSGIYIADAVGHGMAAGLLTMFIKRTVVPKRIDATGYHVMDPSEVIATLNDALAEQSLPQCQFVTACYALIDHSSLQLEYARGGHPYPILITGDGIVSEVKATGGLLGLFKGEQYPSHRLSLRPKDKVVFYTDGVEMSFASNASKHSASPVLDFFGQHARMPIHELMGCMERHLDNQDGSLHPADDITLVGFEVI